MVFFSVLRLFENYSGNHLWAPSSDSLVAAIEGGKGGLKRGGVFITPVGWRHKVAAGAIVEKDL